VVLTTPLGLTHSKINEKLCILFAMRLTFKSSNFTLTVYWKVKIINKVHISFKCSQTTQIIASNIFVIGDCGYYSLVIIKLFMEYSRINVDLTNGNPQCTNFGFNITITWCVCFINCAYTIHATTKPLLLE